mgnify:FL=1
MNVSYSQPLSDAWLRMKLLLFRPFDLGRWFVLGFTAWLAELAGGYSGGASEKIRISEDVEVESFGDLVYGATDRVGDFLNNPWAFLLAGMILTGVIVIWLLVLWISSRGRFMFLDNLVHRRTEVKAPWSEFAAQGDSLFLWQIAYSLAVFVIMSALFVGTFLMFFPVQALNTPLVATVPLAILLGTVVFILVVTVVYIEFFLTQFVVPLMYRERISTTEAWRRFGPLLRAHPGEFVLFGLLYFGIMLCGWFLYLAGGLLTCCVGLLLLAVPYIGSVLTLPMLTLGRYFSLEFLGQFGPEYRLLQPVTGDPGHPYGSGEVQGDGTVVGPEDVTEDPGADEPGPQGS